MDLLDGTELRQLRVRAQMSLREVAARSGLSPSYLCDLELNRRHLSEARYKKVASAIKRRRGDE